MINKRKIIYSILKEIAKGEIEPKATHYEISTAEFGDIVSIMEEDKLIKGSGVSRGGVGNEVRVVFLTGAKITIRGLEYLEDNSGWAKTYKGNTRGRFYCVIQLVPNKGLQSRGPLFFVGGGSGPDWGWLASCS